MSGVAYPSGTNTFVPQWDASGKLAIGFSRNAKQFPLMKWAQLIQSDKNVGYYLRLDMSESVRVVDPTDYAWSRGSEAPHGEDGLSGFFLTEFRTNRNAYPCPIDADAVDQADWDVKLALVQTQASKLMTSRTVRMLAELSKTANFTVAGSVDPEMSADHTGTATAFAGGYLDQGTTSQGYIKKFFDKASVLINMDTNGVVVPSQLQALMNPNTARLLAESPELRDYIKSSPAAEHEIRTGSSPNATYGPGLPSSLYGIPIVVDNTVRITSKKKDALVKGFAFPDQTVALISRVGELEGNIKTPNYSTATIFWYRDEMTIEEKYDADNRRYLYRIVEDTKEIITCPLSGYLLTAATSVAS